MVLLLFHWSVFTIYLFNSFQLLVISINVSYTSQLTCVRLQRNAESLHSILHNASLFEPYKFAN